MSNTGKKSAQESLLFFSHPRPPNTKMAPHILSAVTGTFANVAIVYFGYLSVEPALCLRGEVYFRGLFCTAGCVVVDWLGGGQLDPAFAVMTSNPPLLSPQVTPSTSLSQLGL